MLSADYDAIQWIPAWKVYRRIPLEKGKGPLNMPDRIRKTDFTWDPAYESRGAAWNRIKRHVTNELDRIQRDHVMRRRFARRQAAPGYERNASIYRAHLAGAVSEQALAKEYGLRRERVHEIIRTERHWRHVMAPFSIAAPDSRQQRPSRHLPELFASTPKTTKMCLDP